MANDPQSVAEIRNRFRQQIEDEATTATGDALSEQLWQQRKWPVMSLGMWTGSLTHIEGMGGAFDREEIAQDFKDAIKDASAPGTVGDLMVSQLQGDYLACCERAFRARHSTVVRDRMHAASRRRGHGHAKGVLKGGILFYLEELLRASKDK